MRICIFGAGAVGSHFAVRLALAGHEVSCVMRGPHLEAVKAKDLTLRVDGAGFTAHVKASDDPAELGPQDVVISTLKANSLGSLVTGLPPLLRDHTAVVFAQNGIPWWYDIGLAADAPPPDLGFLDPGGAAASPWLPRSGSSAAWSFPPTKSLRPESSPIFLPTATCCWSANATITAARGSSGCAPISTRPRSSRRRWTNIRETIWTKLLTNMSMSVLCLLTGQTARAVRDEPDLQDIIPRLLDEANAVAQSCFPGVKRLSRSGPAPDHKPSILQDYELGRAMEIDALVRAPAAFARAAGLSTPMLDFMAALAIRMAREKGLYQG